MKEPKHTPGPWIITKPRKCDADQVEDSLIVSKIDGKPQHIAEVFQYRNEQNHNADGTAVANARLIATAPELLKACRKIDAYLQGIQTGKKFEEADLVAMVQSAIAKAEGNEQ